jgi:hypothetical protein
VSRASISKLLKLAVEAIDTYLAAIAFAVYAPPPSVQVPATVVQPLASEVNSEMSGPQPLMQ